MGWIQQCADQRWWPMEGHIQHPSRLLWTNDYVLWLMQCPSNLLKHDEWDLCRYDLGRMAYHLYRWYPYYIQPMSIHWKCTIQVLKQLQEWDLYLKAEKSEFEVTEVEYLGVILHPNEVLRDPIKLKAILDWQSPKTVKQVQAFLGFRNFYKWFIWEYSQVVWPLTNLTKKGCEVQMDPWLWSSISGTQNTLYIKSYTMNPRHFETILSRMWCFKSSDWSSSPAIKPGRILAPMCIRKTSFCKILIMYATVITVN